MEHRHPRVGDLCYETSSLASGAVDEVHQGDYVLVRLRRSGEHAPVDWERFLADWRIGEPEASRDPRRPAP